MFENPAAPRECLRTDLTTWEIGPYHGALPGPMRLKLRLDGEVIVSGQVETGYLHRGLEKAFELHPWRAGIIYADRLDPEGAVFGELALCLAVEEMAGLPVPHRAQVVRLILSELTRVSCHLNYAVKVGRAIGGDTFVHYVLRDREKILDLFELLTGARFSLNFFRFGGIRADVTEGFIERVSETCDLLRIRLKEYNDLMTFNQVFMKRTVGVGVLSVEDITRWGVTGPNARASGLSFDVRKGHPYGGYDKIDLEVPIGKGEGGYLGDAHQRFLLRLREISQSLEILKNLVETIPSGPYLAEELPPGELDVPKGEAYVRVESSRGMLACHVMSEGGNFPSRVQFRAPTVAHLKVLPKLLTGLRIEDLPVVLASLDLNIAEADR
jgi:NADH-quinone oxidoreductase subunit D